MGAEAITAIIAAATAAIVAIINAWRPRTRRRNAVVDAIIKTEDENTNT